jgi:hypothetical protein
MRDALHRAVRRTLRSTGIVMAGLGAASIASAAPFPAVFPLASLLPGLGGDGSAGFVLNGVVSEFAFTGSVGAAGDVNGDGIDDLIIGASGANPDGNNDSGQSYVVFGRDTAQAGNFDAVLPLESLFPENGGDGSVGFALNGVKPKTYSGTSVSTAGDVNGDGIDDLIVGAPDQIVGVHPAGRSYIVFGRDTGQVGNFPGVFQLAQLLPSEGGDGSLGFVLDGVNSGDGTGLSASTAGDVNGDGIGDLIVGAPFADARGQAMAGQSYVVFGRNTSQVGDFPALLSLASLLPANGGDGSAGFAINGVHEYDNSGCSVQAAGDVNGDGIGDLIIGAKDADSNGHTDRGQAYVVFGRATTQTGNFPAVLELASLFPPLGGDGSSGFVVSGIGNSDHTGYSVSGAGDVNGDGVDDVIIGAPKATPPSREDYAGESYVVFGRNTAQLGNFPAVLLAWQILGGDGSTGFALTGIHERDNAAKSVSAADLNGDGIDDLIIGTSTASPRGATYAGETYVVFGRNTAQVGNFPAVFPLATLLPGAGGDGSSGFILPGIHAHDGAGIAAGTPGDINGDSVADLIIGAPFTDLGGQDAVGQIYVVFGRGAAR